LARTLPVQCKICAGVEKWVLRQALSGVVPEEVRTRRKHPFTAPPASLFGGEFLQDTLRSRVAADVPFLEADRLATVLDALPGLSSERKLRLYACGWAREVWRLLNDRSREAVEVAERYADGQASRAELLYAGRSAWAACAAIGKDAARQERGDCWPKGQVAL